jgi:lipopolysaccharide transport system permease protein
MRMEVPELVFEPAPQRRLGHALRELWNFRGGLLAFAERDVRVKYKQAALGIGWAVVQPLAFMAIFVFAFGHAAKIPGGGAPYAAFTLSALVPWTFLQNGVTFGAQALLTDAALLRKVYFPREVPVLGAVLAGIVDLGIGLALFCVLGPIVGASVSPTWILAPLLAVPLALLACGVGLALASLNVYYRDFRYALPFVLQLWLFGSPVAYPLTVVPEQWRNLYVALNPAAGILDAFREVLALGELPNPTTFGISAVGCLVVAWVGYRLFKRFEPGFADVV